MISLEVIPFCAAGEGYLDMSPTLVSIQLLLIVFMLKSNLSFDL